MATRRILFFFLPAPAYRWHCGGHFRLAIAGFAVTAEGGKIVTKSKFIVRLKGFAWTREDFCRGWLITGDTGSGKTSSGINPTLLFQVFSKTIRTGAGFALTTKAWYWETLVEYGAQSSIARMILILLQVRPDNPPDKMEASAHFQSAFRPDHPAIDLRKICGGYGYEPGTTR